ncbi:MAG: TM0106 family RecB-like putative nuclease [Patescibacteria group bacterium]|nr:TM0106 family RecB-like putative nuclease [Patescibacteria group bacterium]MDE2437971.1 TM0106 family RecB-like putative nuclease [Patescibacteria group bacterium]
MEIFTPQQFFKYATCPHWIWHDQFSDPKDKGELSELTLKLFEQGVLHEEQYIKGLDLVSVTAIDPDEAFEQTMKLMRSGADLIYQGAIQYDKDDVRYRGRPDLLQKVSGMSNLGDYFYYPIDIKSSKEIKKEQKLQLILYAVVLEHIQGKFPNVMAIINRDHEKVEYQIDSEDVLEMQKMIDEIHAIIKGKKPPLKLVSKCKNSPWYEKCKEEAEKAEDIALIYRLDSRAYPTLRECGINTIQDAAKMDIDELPKVPYASVATLERAKIQAQALIDKEIHWIGDPQIPDAPLKLYFDIEGDPLLFTEYLFGFWVSGDPDGKYAKIGNVVDHKDEGKYFLYFLAEQPEQESALWNDFLSWLKLLPQEFRVYHYANYEKSHTNALAVKYGTSEAFEYFLTRLVDLEEIRSESVIFPLYFYSIKDIAKSKFVNFKWRHEKAGGGQSIFWFEKWLETGDRGILNDIVNYNEDDVRATEFLHRWLEEKKLV